jgi:HEAT repeat protein
MSIFLTTLSEGDLRTDGFANEVARIVAENPALLPELVEALHASDPAVRGHAADALEKVARTKIRDVAAFLPDILRSALEDDVGMVRWHLAMVLGYLAVIPEMGPTAAQALLALLADRSAFVRAWAITSLCLLARNAPARTEAILQGIAPLAADSSAAVAKRAQTALRLLSDPDEPLPKTWVKSSHHHT